MIGSIDENPRGLIPRLWRGAASAVLLLAQAAIPGQAQTVPTYHADAARSGHYTVPGLTWAAAPAMHRDTGFSGTVNGHVYAQPLYWLPSGARTGQIIVATESNDVYALDAVTGTQIWHRSLGAAVQASALPCGDIDPSGVTGTPVIDSASGTLYLNALVNRANGPRHQIFAISLNDGVIGTGWPLDVGDGIKKLGQSFTPTIQDQRSALTLVGQELYVTYGGNSRDCDSYHGWVVGLELGAPPRLAHAWGTRALRGGIWAQGGIAYDGGAMFVATGNTSGATQWGDGEAVVHLGPDLAHSIATADYFAPANWKRLDLHDLDLGGTSPLPIDVPTAKGPKLARVLALGKDGEAYLLNRADLGGIGGQLAVVKVSSVEIVTAPATFTAGDAVLVAFGGTGTQCPRGQSGNLTMLRIVDAKIPIGTAWCESFSGRAAPIVTTSDGAADPIVWIAGAEGDNRLHGFRGTDGKPLFTGGAAQDGMSNLHHFGTILAAAGRFYIASDGRIYAFAF